MTKEWYQANRDRCLLLSRQWKARPENRARILETKKRDYQNNKAKRTATNRKWLAANKEKMAKWFHENYIRNKERKREYDRLRRANMSEADKERMRIARMRWHLAHPGASHKWQKEHPDLARKAKREWAKKHPALYVEACRRRKSKLKKNDSAKSFYDFVRSKERIRCYYCGEWTTGKEAHIDHVIAVSRDGNHASDNLCASCPSCNYKKNDKLPSQINWVSQGVLNL